MNIGYNHLIAKHGVLSAFSIAKKVSPKDIKKITDKIKNKSKCKSQEAFNKLLQEEIINSTKYTVNKESIPGIICDNNKNTNNTTSQYTMDNKKTLGLGILANEIAKKLSQNKYSKDEICYLILNLLGILGLTDDDFREFHRKYNPNYIEDDEDDEDDFAPE